MRQSELRGSKGNCKTVPERRALAVPGFLKKLGKKTVLTASRV